MQQRMEVQSHNHTYDMTFQNKMEQRFNTEKRVANLHVVYVVYIREVFGISEWWPMAVINAPRILPVITQSTRHLITIPLSQNCGMNSWSN